MKKLLVLLVLPLLFVTGCGEEKSGKLNKNDLEVLGVEAIASLNASSAFKSTRAAQSDDVIGKLKQAEVLLGEEISFNEAESDRSEYSGKYEITFQGETYNFYISSTKYETDEEETEVEFNGLLVHGENEYRYEAEYETEEEDGESEKELNLTLFYTDTKTVKIEREFEVENNEVEESFKYTLKDNGQVISTYEVERENDENEKSLEITINSVIYKFSFYVSENVEYVEVKIGETKLTYMITDVDGEKTYTLMVE